MNDNKNIIYQTFVENGLKIIFMSIFDEGTVRNMKHVL